MIRSVALCQVFFCQVEYNFRQPPANYTISPLTPEHISFLSIAVMCTGNWKGHRYVHTGSMQGRLQMNEGRIVVIRGGAGVVARGLFNWRQLWNESLCGFFQGADPATGASAALFSTSPMDQKRSEARPTTFRIRKRHKCRKKQKNIEDMHQNNNPAMETLSHDNHAGGKRRISNPNILSSIFN